MADSDRREFVLIGLVIGLCILLGLAIGGYLIGNGAIRFKSGIRTVTVKGLVEKEIKSDLAYWSLRFRRASNSIKDAYDNISNDRKAALEFLKNHGFDESDIRIQPILAIDKLAQEWGQAQGPERLRYVVTATVLVVTKDVDLVYKSLGATDELLRSGVVLDGQSGGAMANPRYVITTFNALRPSLLADATKNARLTAEQFASDSGAQVGRIRTANQGNIQIFGSDGNNESAPYSPTSTLSKKIRVVSTFEFDLR